MSDDIRVLVVDDSEFFAEMTAETLAEDHEMVSDWATGAEEAMDVLAEAEIDCIVSDYEMPGPDGLELLEMVRAEHGEIPFILLTGRGTEEIASEAISAGVDDYILKLEVVEDQQYQQLANRIASAVEQQRTQRRYELLVDNTPDVVAQVERDGTIVAANPAMADLADVDRVSLRGADLTEKLPEIGESWLRVGRTVLETGESRTFETELDGRHFHNIVVPVDIRTERDTFQLIARDVTERTERARELKRKNERLDRFASMVSHDLQGPLNVASMNAKLLAEEFEDVPEELAAIRRSHDRMERLIDDVLTLARQGDTIDDPDPTTVGAAAEKVWPHVDAGGTDLVVDTDAEIMADEARLQELLSNLFRNAVTHGDADTVRVGTRADGTSEGDPDGTDLAFYVADDGTGIPEADRDDVFETGFSTADDGTGFGLAIVEQIADAHGWSVAVGESEGGGARFDVTGVEPA
ncbi:MAG: response regulator [Halorientalis sp.]